MVLIHLELLNCQQIFRKADRSLLVRNAIVRHCHAASCTGCVNKMAVVPTNVHEQENNNNFCACERALVGLVRGHA